MISRKSSSSTSSSKFCQSTAPTSCARSAAACAAAAASSALAFIFASIPLPRGGVTPCRRRSPAARQEIPRDSATEARAVGERERCELVRRPLRRRLHAWRIVHIRDTYRIRSKLLPGTA